MSISLLLADDSPTIAKILLLALQSEDYAIKSVLTAEDALHELKHNPPTIFLCDLTLPGKDGYEFAKLIRSDSKLNKIRVVLLASAFEPVDEVEYQACGADGLIKKPFDPSELRAKLRSIGEAPVRFPEGAKVTGSLSGFLVTREQTNPSMMITIDDGEPEAPVAAPPRPAALPAAVPASLPAAPPPSEAEDFSNLLQGNAANQGGDADSILSNLMGEKTESPVLDLSQSFQDDKPPAFAPLAPAPESAPSPLDLVRREKTGLTDKTFTNATVVLDLTESDLADLPPEAPPSGISASFATPPGGTATIDMSLMGENENEGAPAAEEPLSANAQALAAFFAAEIKVNENSQVTPAPVPAPSKAPPASKATPQTLKAPAPAAEESFDSSLSSIEWNEGPADASLDAWSSSQPKADNPPPFRTTGKTTAGVVSAPAPVQAPPPAAAPRAQARGTGGGSLMFDTGGSSFRFSEDYVNRITKSFTGANGEEVHEAHAAAPAPMFNQKSDDRPTQQTTGTQTSSGFAGGAWSEADVARIEQIVREEVQMVVREVAEKIAWEVIPELAENLIRKELDKVLKEMELN